MPGSPLVVRSPAKINLFLKITGKRADGYHNIATLFQMIDLCDVITFRPLPEGEIRVRCSDRSVPEKMNLAYLAAKALWRPGLPGVQIDIKKNIPSGAGLGGGSSNAATTLAALNHLWKLGYSLKYLRSRAIKLGADVPFFLFGPRAWATGIGDRLKALHDYEKFHVLLIKPRVKISTKEIYDEFDRNLTTPLQSVKIPARLGKGVLSLDDMLCFLTNDLEKIAENKHPVIRRIKGRLLKSGCKSVMLSGSGSAVFAIYRKQSEAHKAFNRMDQSPWWSCQAKVIESMDHWRHLGGNYGNH